MANVTILVTDNGDGTATVTSAATAPAQTVTTKSLTQLKDVMKGRVGTAIPGLLT
jgi:hypothetical protein